MGIHGAPLQLILPTGMSSLFSRSRSAGRTVKRYGDNEEVRVNAGSAGGGSALTTMGHLLHLNSSLVLELLCLGLADLYGFYTWLGPGIIATKSQG